MSTTQLDEKETTEHVVSDGVRAGENSASQEDSRFPAWGRWWLALSLAVGLFLGLGLLGMFFLLARPLAVIVFAMTIAAAMAGPTHQLEKLMPRPIAVILVYAILLLLLAGLLWIAAPSLDTQVQGIADEVSDLFGSLVPATDGSGGQQQQQGGTLMQAVTDTLTSMSERILRWPVTLVSGVFDIIFMVAISIYALIAAPGMREYFRSLLPSRKGDRIDDIMSKILEAMGGYLRGAFISGGIIGILTYIGLTVIGVNYALALALLAGVLELVPMLGTIVSMAVITLVALVQSTSTALIAFAFMLVLQQVEGNLIFPFVMSGQTDISPLLSLLAFFAGLAVGGILGALVAIPVAAALRVFFTEVVVPRIRRANQASSAPEAT